MSQKSFLKVSKILFLYAFAAFSGASLKGATPAERPYDPKVIEFAGVIDRYIEIAKPHDNNLTEDDVTNLKELGDNAARLYFDLTPDSATIGEQMLQALAKRVSDNPSLNEEFVFLGNAFVQKAGEIANQPQTSESRSLRFTTIGGVAGVVMGGLIVWVGKMTTGSLIAGGLIFAGCTGLGIWADHHKGLTNIPADKTVQTAKDFQKRFPSGRDVLNYQGTNSIPARPSRRIADLGLTNNLLAETLAGLQ